MQQVCRGNETRNGKTHVVGNCTEALRQDLGVDKNVRGVIVERKREGAGNLLGRFFGN